MASDERVQAYAGRLEAAGLTAAEFAVLWHVDDTVVVERRELAEHTAKYPPNVEPSPITTADCLGAINALIARGLLEELDEVAIAADLDRWRREPLPVSWGVDRGRQPGDVDLTEAGYQLMTRFNPRSSQVGFNDEVPDQVRVFGRTAEVCAWQLEAVLATVTGPPKHWARSLIEVGALVPLGPWWASRYERVPTGVEVLVRHRATGGLPA